MDIESHNDLETKAGHPRDAAVMHGELMRAVEAFREWTFPLIDTEDTPDVAADSLSVAFGNFARGYPIVDRAGVAVLRDPYSAKLYVMFYTTKQVGGGGQDLDAIKLMKFAVS